MRNSIVILDIMKKFLLILFVAFVFGVNNAFAKDVTGELSKGTFVMVYPKKPITTETYQEGDFVYFVNPSDVWQGDYNVFPKDTIFAGFVSMLKLPVQGINAALQIKITEVVYPNGRAQDVNATIYKNDKSTIGGGLTPPASYNKSVHKTRGWAGGALQWVPSGVYEFGKHTVMPTNEPVFVVLDENFKPQY